jgi:hypothetical protein
MIRLHSEIKTEDGDIITANQIKELQKCNVQAEEDLFDNGCCEFFLTMVQQPKKKNHMILLFGFLEYTFNILTISFLEHTNY